MGDIHALMGYNFGCVSALAQLNLILSADAQSRLAQLRHQSSSISSALAGARSITREFMHPNSTSRASNYH